MLSYEVLLDSFDFRFLEPCCQPYIINIFVLLHIVSPLKSYLRFIPGVEGRVEVMTPKSWCMSWGRCTQYEVLLVSRRSQYCQLWGYQYLPFARYSTSIPASCEDRLQPQKCACVDINLPVGPQAQVITPSLLEAVMFQKTRQTGH